jgi:hypothetical protein
LKNASHSIVVAQAARKYFSITLKDDVAVIKLDTPDSKVSIHFVQHVLCHKKAMGVDSGSTAFELKFDKFQTYSRVKSEDLIEW